MWNLYSLTKGQPAIRDLFAAKHDRTANFLLPCMPSGRTSRAAPSLFAYLPMNSIVCWRAAGETR
jgi:hypothetical protein